MTTKTIAGHLANPPDKRLRDARLMFYGAMLSWDPSAPNATMDRGTETPTKAWVLNAADAWREANPGAKALRGPSVGEKLLNTHFGEPGSALAVELAHVAPGKTGVPRLVQETKELTFEPMLAGAARECLDLGVDPTARALALMGSVSGWTSVYPHLAVLGHCEAPTCLVQHLRAMVGPVPGDALAEIASVVIRVAARTPAAPLSGLGPARGAVNALHLDVKDRDEQKALITASLSAYLLNGVTEEDLYFAQILKRHITRLNAMIPRH